MTYKELTKLAIRWLRKQRNHTVISEMVSLASEVPDAIGWKEGISTLIECKTSRSDFLKDLKKYFRIRPESGMGRYRYYMCPNVLIHEDELPEKWGLLYVMENTDIMCVTGAVNYSNPFEKHAYHQFSEFNYGAEMIHLCSALRRKK